MRIQEAIQQHMINQMLHTCQHELELDHIPPIEFLNEPFVKGGNKTSFGEFDGETIKVVVQGRHPMDIMRTLSHELCHYKQNLTGQYMDGSDGSDAENQANAVAGIIMRKFAEKYPDYFINSLPN